MEIVIIILAGLWLYSYVGFRKRYKIDKLMCGFTRQRYEMSPSPMTELEYGSALMQAQQYSSAMAMFEGICRKVGHNPLLDENIAFCKKPLPWSGSAKDHKGGSWMHNFLLVRFGGRRRVAISDATALDFNSMLRRMGR